MFSGIIEYTGTVKRIVSRSEGKRVYIHTGLIKQVKGGDSIAVDGVCLTVEEVKRDVFIVFLSQETLRSTKFGRVLSVGKKVNLELALRYGDRIGGHIITGHVDTPGKIERIKKERDVIELEISIEVEHMRNYITRKSSVAVDGVSLTVNERTPRGFSLLIIPYTIEKTTLSDKKTGELVNIEFDYIGRYVVDTVLREFKYIIKAS